MILHDEFIRIIQLGPAELKQCRTSLHTPIASCYGQILQNYYEGDVDQLKNHNIQNTLNFTEKIFIDIILPLRIGIRECCLDIKFLNTIEDKSQNIEVHFKAEILFVLAMAFETIKEDETALKYFHKSFQLLTDIGAFSKASKAFHNSICAESRLEINRYRIFIPDYLKAYEFSKKYQDVLTEGMSLTNISKEYHRIGALPKALKYALKAYRVLEKEMNTYNFHLSTLNLCQILIEFRRFEEAAYYMKLIEGSKYPDVLESIKVLYCLSHKASHDHIKQEKVPQNWILKLLDRNQVNLEKYSVHEKLVIEKLTSGPQSKEALIVSLYGNALDSFSAELRFKNLIVRLRKKSPEIVEYKHHRYYLKRVD